LRDCQFAANKWVEVRSSTSTELIGELANENVTNAGVRLIGQRRNRIWNGVVMEGVPG